MIVIIGLVSLIFYIMVIVTYFSMSNRLDEISANTMNTKNYVKMLTQQNFELQKQLMMIHSAQIAGRKQYFYDHCFAANMGPHEWICTGSGPHVIEYTCRKCGQKLLAPRYLDVEPPAMIQPVANQSEK